MFYLRGLLVSVSAFVLLYVLVSACVCLAWPRIHSRSRHLAPRVAANVLYALRLSPVAVSSLVVLVFCVPSFLWFEPHASGEAPHPSAPSVRAG